MAQASHQCGPGSIPRLGVICGLSMLLFLVPATRVFLRVLRFSSLRKNQYFLVQIPIRPGLYSFHKLTTFLTLAKLLVLFALNLKLLARKLCCCSIQKMKHNDQTENIPLFAFNTGKFVHFYSFVRQVN